MMVRREPIFLLGTHLASYIPSPPSEALLTISPFHKLADDGFKNKVSHQKNLLLGTHNTFLLTFFRGICFFKATFGINLSLSIICPPHKKGDMI